jgi:ABC-type uncharacterized transport system substrate-binding protein
VTSLAVELVLKRLELLHEFIPHATKIAVLQNPNNDPNNPLARNLLEAARGFGIELHDLHASHERDFTNVFAELQSLQADALLINPNLLFNTRSEQLAALTVHPRADRLRGAGRGCRSARATGGASAGGEVR